MGETRGDIILHPIRMRLLTALSGQQLTAQQLARALPDVPQATLYRHINTLVQHEILRVVEERQVRGTVERVYALDDRGARLGPDEVHELTNADHFRFFTAFTTSLLADFARYVGQQPHVDIAADGVSYNKGLLHLTDDELEQVKAGVRGLLMPLLSLGPRPGTRPRIFATALLPAADAPPVDAER